jgi:hypothetical protein
MIGEMHLILKPLVANPFPAIWRPSKELQGLWAWLRRLHPWALSMPRSLSLPGGMHRVVQAGTFLRRKHRSLPVLPNGSPGVAHRQRVFRPLFDPQKGDPSLVWVRWAVPGAKMPGVFGIILIPIEFGRKAFT